MKKSQKKHGLKMFYKKRAIMKKILTLLLLNLLLLTGCSSDKLPTITPTISADATDNYIEEPLLNSITDLNLIPKFDNKPFIEINDNSPNFLESEITSESFESFSNLDELGRVGIATASIGVDIMPTEDRESISHIDPSAWQSVKYDSVSGGWLYNRSHLIGFQLTGENDNDENLMTGTRYMNVDGMLPFENMIADYVKETENNVMYRVTPHFIDNELLARGVQLEAYSIEDAGDGVSFNVYVYNNQPNIELDYANGNSIELKESGEPIETKVPTDETVNETESEGVTYILNTDSLKYHKKSCHQAEKIKAENYGEHNGTGDEVEVMGYTPCGTCKP